MKCVLISPNERGILQNAGDRMPLSLMHLSGALRTYGISHNLIDLNKVSNLNALEYIKSTTPDYVGVTYLTPTKEQMNSFIKYARELSPRTKFIAGGVDVTNDQKKSNADIEIVGPGENQLVDLIMGTHTEFDIDRFPVNRKAFNPNDYNYQIDGFKAATMITSRGCHNQCSFCSVPEKKVTNRSLERISEELTDIKENHQVVHIYDDSFLANRYRALDVMDTIKRSGLKYRIEARAEHINKDIAKKLSETGCIKVAIGIESGNNDILRKSHKSSTIEIVENAVRNLYENGIKTKGYFIIGLPGETEETARQTISFSRKLSSYGLTSEFYPLVPFKGSPIANNPDKYGIKILNDNPSTYITGGVDLVIPTETDGLKASRIKELIMETRR